MGVSEAIRRGWSVTWRCKYLWLLAFLAGVVTFDSSDITGGSPTFEAVESSGFYEELNSLDNLSPAAIGALILAFIGIVILFLFVGLLLWLLGKIAKAGLIHASAHLDDGQKVTLGESFKVGIKMLGRMVGTSLLLYGPLILLFLLMILIAGVIGFFGESGAAGSMSFGFISLICLLFVYIIAASLIQPFAERGIVLQDLGVFDGIRHGWWVLITNFGSILGLGIVLFLLMIPFFALVTIISLLTGSIPILTSLITIIVNAVLGSLISSSYTVAYKRFTGWKPPVVTQDQAMELTAIKEASVK